MQVLSTIISILQAGLPYAFLALGLFVSYRVLDIADLTTEGSFTLGGCLSLALTAIGVNSFLAVLIGIVAGFASGVITGLLHTKLHIPSLLSGIITMTALIAINLVIMGIAVDGAASSNAVTIGSSGRGPKSIFDFFAIFNKPVYNQVLLMVIVLILLLVIMYLFFGTEFGQDIRATGMNKNMAKAQGINTSLMIILGLGISNAIIALGGAMWGQSARSFEIGNGTGALVIGLAAIILGETVFGKRTFKNWLISISLGAIIYFAIIQIAIILSFPHYLMKLLYAFLITVALSIPLIQKLFKKKKKAVNNNA